MPSFKLAFLALAASLVSAQIDLSQIPTCALTPAIAALGSSGCAETDIKCICDSTAFLTSLLPAVKAACSAADLTKAETFASNLCLSAGVTIAIPGNAPTTAAPAPPPSTAAPAPPPSTAAPAPPNTEGPAPPTSAAPSPPASTPAPGTGIATVYVTVCASSGIALPTGTGSPAGNLTGTVTKSALPSVFTGAAAAEYVSGATIFGGLVAAVAMLL